MRILNVSLTLLVMFFSYTAFSNDKKDVPVMTTKQKEVLIYTMEGCPYCERAVSFLNGQKVAYQKVDVGSNRKEWEVLIQKTGARTVPYIFIDGKYIGGCSDLLSLAESDKLKELLY